MRSSRLLIGLLACLLWITPAAAQLASTGGGGSNRVTPYDPFPDANSSAKFKANDCKVALVSTPCTTYLTTTATSGRYMQAAGPYGTWTLVAAGSPRINDRGLWGEPARITTISGADARDLTGINWVKLNVTAAKDQTGIDGVANAASSLTINVGQTSGTASFVVVTGGSRSQTLFAKLVTGTPTIEQTQNLAGSGYSTMGAYNAGTGAGCMDGDGIPTAPNTTGYVRCRLPVTSQSTSAIRLTGVAGDKVAIDFAQNENSTFPTTPIPTASATRALDQYQITDATGINFDNNSVFTTYSNIGPAGIATNAMIWALRQTADGVSNRLFLEFGSQVAARTDNVAVVATVVTGRNFTNDLTSYPQTYKNGFAVGSGNIVSAWSPNLGTDITTAVAAVPTGAITAYLTSNAGGGICSCIIEEFANVPSTASNAQLIGYVDN